VSLTSADLDATLKDYYTTDKIKEQSYGENPFFAMIPKESSGGRQVIGPIEYNHPGGASASYVTASINASNAKSKYDDAVLPWRIQYQRQEITGQLLYQTESPRGAFRKAFDEFDRTLRALGHKVGKRLYRTGGGRAAKLNNTTTATATLTLDDPADTFNFLIGDMVQFAAADGTGSMRDSGATLQVTQIDNEAGTLTVNANLSTITGAQATDFVFLQDDFGACLSGLEDWIPGGSTRATQLAATFAGMTNRADNPVLLGGVHLDGTKYGGLDEVMIKLVGKIAKYGGNTTHIFANPESLTDLQLTTSSKMFLPQPIYSSMKNDDGEVIVGFSGYQVQIGGKTVKVYGDRNCPSNRIWAIQMDTWKLYHLGPDPILRLGEEMLGQWLHKNPNADSLYADFGNYCNVMCSAPGWNGSAAITPSN
jgi:hypothetical protein